jgi:hypothetical protein
LIDLGGTYGGGEADKPNSHPAVKYHMNLNDLFERRLFNNELSLIPQPQKQQEQAIVFDSETRTDMYGNSVSKKHLQATGITPTNIAWGIGGAALMLALLKLFKVSF